MPRYAIKLFKAKGVVVMPGLQHEDLKGIHLDNLLRLDSECSYYNEAANI